MLVAGHCYGELEREKNNFLPDWEPGETDEGKRWRRYIVIIEVIF